MIFCDSVWEMSKVSLCTLCGVMNSSKKLVKGSLMLTSARHGPGGSWIVGASAKFGSQKSVCT